MGAGEQAVREKTAVALSSVFAGLVLTGIKLVVGILTGSLGILAEAAHSGLDLLAALITYTAVRVSDRPPDATHPYGHGKVENLSALAETILLLITCAWIIYEAVNRLLFKAVEIDANAWAFAVMAISIIVDFNRSRALQRTAERHDSQALEADALHFRTDIWSSTVVIAGLAIVRLTQWFGWPPALVNADAVAALGVAVIVIYVSLQLGRRSIAVLLDAAPEGLAQEIRSQVEGVEGVTVCRQVRMRRAGARTFADIVVEIDADASFERAHEITHAVEGVVHRLCREADVVVHYEPSEERAGLASRIKGIAKSMGADAHSIWAREIDGRYHVELHLEVERGASLEEGHDLASRLETGIKEAVPEVAKVVAHIEPVGDIKGSGISLISREHAEVVDKIVALTDALTVPGACYDVTVWEEDAGLAASLHCSFCPAVSVEGAHDLSEELEARLRAEIADLQRVVIHLEPPASAGRVAFSRS